MLVGCSLAFTCWCARLGKDGDLVLPLFALQIEDDEDADQDYQYDYEEAVNGVLDRDPSVVAK